MGGANADLIWEAVDGLGNWNNVLNVAEPIPRRRTAEYEEGNPDPSFERSDDLMTASISNNASFIRIPAVEIDAYEPSLPMTEAARRPPEAWEHDLMDVSSAGERIHSFHLPAKHSLSFSFECMTPQFLSDEGFGKQFFSGAPKHNLHSLPLEANGDGPSDARADEGQPLLRENTQKGTAKIGGKGLPNTNSSNNSQDESSWLSYSLRLFVAWISSLCSRLCGSSK